MEIGKKRTSKLGPSAYRALVRSSAKLTLSRWTLDHVHYLSCGGTRWFELSFVDLDAPSLVVPVNNIQELAAATVKDLHELHLSPARDTIISDTLDVHISVEGLIRDMQLTLSPEIHGAPPWSADSTAQKLDDVVAALPPERRAKIERRALELAMNLKIEQGLAAVQSHLEPSTNRPDF